MKDLWRALSLIGNNTDGLLDRVREIAFQETSNLKAEVELGESPADSRKMFMKPQPTWDRLGKIYQLFVRHGIYLAAYEVAEINRWVCEDRDRHSGQSMDAVRTYWQEIATNSGVSPNKSALQEAAGAMAIDNRLRYDFGNGVVKDLRDYGFDLTPEEQEGLRKVVAPQQPASIAADKFFRFSWPGSTCGGIMLPYPDWFHVNL